MLTISRLLHILSLPPLSLISTPSTILQPDGIPYKVDTDDGPRGIQTGINVSRLYHPPLAISIIARTCTPVLLEWRCCSLFSLNRQASERPESLLTVTSLSIHHLIPTKTRDAMSAYASLFS
jgi:hypothetical protein